MTNKKYYILISGLFCVTLSICCLSATLVLLAISYNYNFYIATLPPTQPPTHTPPPPTLESIKTTLPPTLESIKRITVKEILPLTQITPPPTQLPSPVPLTATPPPTSTPLPTATPLPPTPPPPPPPTLESFDYTGYWRTGNSGQFDQKKPAIEYQKTEKTTQQLATDINVFWSLVVEVSNIIGLGYLVNSLPKLLIIATTAITFWKWFTK